MNPFGNLIPGLNVGNIFRTIGSYSTGQGIQDYDILDGISAQGGSRNAANGVLGTTSTAKPNGGGGGGGAWGSIPKNDGSGYSQQMLGATYGVGGGGAGGGASYNPADLAYLDDQQGRLQRQQASIDAAERNGITQLQDSYNKEVSGANTRRSQALEDFATKRSDTERAKDSAIGRVDSNARTLADSLRRRIGMASGSGSSAYQITAPGAVARDASMNRTGVLENFGTNLRDLTTSENRAKTAFEELLADLDAQRRTRESEFKAGILDRRNQVDSSLAEIARQRALVRGGGYDQVRTAMSPYASAIDARQSQIDTLFDKYRTPYNVKQIDVRTPDLKDYTVDRAAINANTEAGTQDPYSPYRKPFQEDEEQLY